MICRSTKLTGSEKTWVLDPYCILFSFSMGGIMLEKYNYLFLSSLICKMEIITLCFIYYGNVLNIEWINKYKSYLKK